MDDHGFESMNMVPFIDIMLVLLTIVLMTSSFMVSGKIPLHLPQAEHTETDHSQPRALDIDAAGVLYLDGKVLPLSALANALRDEDRQTAFLLRADQSIALQQFIQVVDALQGQGFARIAIQTEALQ